VERFAELIDRLVYSGSRNAKLRLIENYFRLTPDPDRGYALAVLTDGLPLRLPYRRIVAELVEPFVDPVLHRLSRDYVGDSAETVALLWPDCRGGSKPPGVSEIAEALMASTAKDAPALIRGWLDGLDSKGRFALLKLMTGALRVGVSARLAKTALAAYGNVDVAEIEEVWHGATPPYEALFRWLDGKGPRPEASTAAMFRPLMLAHPIEDRELGELDPEAFAAEWKWDGIRVQISANGFETRLFSRSGDDISAAFPDIIAAFASFRGVADGELLVLRDGVVQPFNDLQQRLNRKAVSAKLVSEHPAHIRLYDLLFEVDEDIRNLPFRERRDRLAKFIPRHHLPRADLSPLVPFLSFEELHAMWSGSREAGIEGLMLKRWESPYVSGRPRGLWYKWKRAPLTLDCVLMYAQRGSGKRSSYYSDYTFGAWRQGDNGADELVPVGKAYSGFTDEELLRLDRFVRHNTIERFGPVRAVRPSLVLEVAFDAVQASTRHKSGVAMRFPRIHRIRWDKPAVEADRLDTLLRMI
jgi:ATP-dependent DNA ligase